MSTENGKSLESLLLNTTLNNSIAINKKDIKICEKMIGNFFSALSWQTYRY